MNRRRLFLAAYACSGAASLLYEVSWTRLFGLLMGHGTAAATTVVAAFMGGLAIGSAVAARWTPRLTPSQCLRAYIWLECAAGVMVLLLPYELAAATPLLRWAYRDGAPGLAFPALRVLLALLFILVPSSALGATFPVAVRWFVTREDHPGRSGGILYAVNAAGAAIGAVAAGFVLIPTFGLFGTTLISVAVGGVVVVSVLVLDRTLPNEPPAPVRRPLAKAAKQEASAWQGLALLALGLSGLVSLMYEIAWTRILALVLGPTTYAFSATVAVMISGIALGSAAGSWWAGRKRQPAFDLGLVLIATSAVVSWTCSIAGNGLPRSIAAFMASSSHRFDQVLVHELGLAVALILPAAFGFGAAFPLAFEMLGASRRFGVAYAVNTVAAVTGALVAGFISIPLLGLEGTLRGVGAALVAGGAVLIGLASPTPRARTAGLLAVLGVAAMMFAMPSWDRHLIASGVYKYAPEANRDLESSLKAGTLLYYRDGAAGTVSVKESTGRLSLAIDGKVDASNSGDMLTQKLLAHLPLLLHSNPRDVAIVGLGSGVTAAAALVHPVARVDVVEISPEVVEASRYFATENRNALADARVHLVQGDGRTHLLLSSRQYDVVISEPSNPWMAGVASLFTQEFFTAVRDRLAPGGIFCQWAHTYDISDRDLRSIVATFRSVFPRATLWMVGDSDMLLVASTEDLDPQLANIARGWQRPGVQADLSAVSVRDPFALLSMFAAGPAELARFAQTSALQSDNRLALEFSGPRALAENAPNENAATLLALVGSDHAPAAIRQARAAAGAVQWRDRGAMLFGAFDYLGAYESYEHALALDHQDGQALEGLGRAAVGLHREGEAINLLKSLPGAAGAPPILVAISRLQAAAGAPDQAIASALEASRIEPVQPLALEQLASLFADLGDVERLEPIVSHLQTRQPDRASTRYYAAVVSALRNRGDEALRLAQDALRLDPAYAAAHTLLGTIYAAGGNREQARAAFESAMKLNPQDATTYSNLGVLELSSANYEAAARAFAEALQLDSESLVARNGFDQAISAGSK